MNAMRSNSLPSCTLLAALLLLLVVLGAVFVWFAFPRENFVAAGPLSNFEPSEDPYVLDRGKHLFIVNDGERVIALDPVSPGRVGCRVQWSEQEKIFIDPCRGDHFDLYGRPVRLAERPLLQYPVKIEEGVIWVDINRTLPPQENAGR
jgi:nitrite reductase/ring-hydroxylating ferredoxin subunit